VFNWVTTDRVIAIVSLIAAVIFYFRQRQFRRLDVIWTNTALQSKNHPKVRILLEQREVTSITRLRVLLVNSGTLAIRPALDFPKKSNTYFYAKTPDDHRTRVYSGAVVASDVEATAGHTMEWHGYLSFEYLNPGQRIVAEWLYAPPLPSMESQMPSIDVTLVGGTVRARPHSQDTLVDSVSPALLTLSLTAAIQAPTLLLARAYGWLNLPQSSWVLWALWIPVSTLLVWLLVRWILPAVSRLRTSSKRSSYVHHLED
jgi:hypothetical protein